MSLMGVDRTIGAEPSGVGKTIIATSLGFVLAQLDVSILNVALARIGNELATGISGLQWVIDSSAISFASLLLSAGALGDRIGARRAYVGGFGLFVLASLGCGLAPGTAVLIAARTVQGAGAALLVACSLALLTHACGDDEAVRGHAISLWTAAASIALSAGPVIGGVLVNTLGWRSIFLVNLPSGAAGIWLTRRFVADTSRTGGPLDPTGQVFALLTLLGLIGAVIEAGRLGFSAPLVLFGFATAALCGVVFLVVEARGSDPMLPLGFFRNPTFSAATLIGLLINLTLYARSLCWVSICSKSGAIRRWRAASPFCRFRWRWGSPILRRDGSATGRVGVCRWRSGLPSEASVIGCCATSTQSRLTPRCCRV
jgi:MFS transporter, DHA2 family, methylenomycin A resistance protein